MLLSNPAHSNVVVSGVNSCRIPLGQIINGLQINFGGTAVDPTTHVGRVVIRLNEKIILDLTAAEIEQINASLGIMASATRLYIAFNEMAALTPGSMLTGSHDTSRGVSAYDLEITTVDAPADITISSKRDVSPAAPNSPGIGLIRTFIPQTLSFTGSGKYTHMPSASAAKKAKIYRLHFLGATVDAIGIKKNSLHIFENVSAADNIANRQYHGGVSVADHFVVDFVKRGMIEEALYTGNAQTLEYEVETSGAGDIKLITEQVINFAAL